MNETVLLTIVFLSVTGAVAAVILFFVAKKFKVIEDPNIDLVDEILPGANCGGCGYPGCRAFAEGVVGAEADEMDTFFCPVGGNDCMAEIATALGREIAAKDPEIAVVRCNGCPSNRPRTNVYDGATSCKIAATLYGGQTGCEFGCLGCGDCCTVCNFDAIHMNAETGLPEVDQDKCTGCNACVEECPKDIIELRKKGKKDRRIFVSCVNRDKGGPAKKSCAVACIGCKKCFKECKFEAITVENNLAYIDPDKCKLCRKCVIVCPTQAIHEINFPARKVKAEAPVKRVVKPTTEKPAVTPDAPVKDVVEPTTVKPPVTPEAEDSNKE